MTAFRELVRLLDSQPLGSELPCQNGSGDWHAASRELRARAADACLDCPVMVACGLGAERRRERHGVWGGVDRESAYLDRYRRTTKASSPADVAGAAADDVSAGQDV